MSKHKNRSRYSTIKGTPPADAVKRDFDLLSNKLVLRCSSDVSDLLVLQSVEGHAHAGHSQFHGKRYPNTTQDHIAMALRLNPQAVKEDRQMLIDEVKHFAERLFNGEDIQYALNTDGEPLMRCSILRFYKIELQSFLMGLYAGGLRDEPGVRELANKIYQIDLGYGKAHYVDQDILDRLGLTGYELAKMPHKQNMREYEDEGLFAELGKENSAYMFVRYKTGLGASDDVGIIMAGKLWGVSAAIGCFLADCIDTLEKYSTYYGDQDAKISMHIQQICKEKIYDKSDAAKLAYLSAIPSDMGNQLPDSSMRHLLEVDSAQDISPLESYLQYLSNQPYSEIELDKGQCTNTELFDYIEQRLDEYRRKWES